MVDSLDAAIGQISAMLTEADSALVVLLRHLETSYAKLHANSPTHTNAYNVVNRVRANLSRLETLRVACASNHAQKVRLISSHGRELHEQLTLSRSLLRTVCPTDSGDSVDDIDGTSALEERLYKAGTDLRQLSSGVGDANAIYRHAFSDGSLPEDVAMATGSSPTAAFAPSSDLRNHAPLSLNSQESSQNIQAEPRDATATDANMRGHVGKNKNNTTGVADGPKSRKATPTASPLAVTDTEAAATPRSVQPISKAVFNRLPRNLKIKAGKLADINQFYEKVVCSFDSASQDVISDKKLMQMTGETSTERFEVLRGLAVLRKTKVGWTLPSPK